MSKKYIILLGVAVTLVGMSGAAFAVYTPIAPEVMDFRVSYQAIYTDGTQPGGTLYGLLSSSSPESIVMLAYLQPNTADINGGYIPASDGPPPTPIIINRNGMLDCDYELAVFATICKKPAGAGVAGAWQRDAVYAAFNGIPASVLGGTPPVYSNSSNIDIFRLNGGSYISLAENIAGPLIVNLYVILAGLVTIGDATTMSTVTNLAGLLSGGTVQDHIGPGVTPGSIPPYFYKDETLYAPNGDADKDGFTNIQEYNLYKNLNLDGSSNAGSGTVFLSAVLDPNTPGSGPVAGADSDKDGLSDEIEVNVTHTLPNTADTDGDGVNDGMEVLVYGTNPLDNNSKPSPLPTVGYAGLALLAMLVGVGGLYMALRKSSSKA